MRGTSWRIRWKFVTHTRPVCSVLAPLREDMTSSRKPTRAPRPQVSTENHTKIGHSVSEICDCRQTNGVTEIQICRHVYRNYCAPFLEAKQNAILWKFVDTIVLWTCFHMRVLPPGTLCPTTSTSWLILSSFRNCLNHTISVKFLTLLIFVF